MKKRTTVMAARFSFVWMFPNFYCCLRTQVVFSPNFSRNLFSNFHCFHMDGICYNEPQIAVGHFKRYFKYTLYIIISVNIVMYSSKDWSFNQILAYLYSFFEHIGIFSIIFCNFAVKQQKSIMAKLNRIRIVLAEHAGSPHCNSQCA